MLPMYFIHGCRNPGDCLHKQLVFMISYSID